MKKLILKKSGREVFNFPWTATSPRPWSNAHTRVLIPTTKADNTDKPFHVQVVRKSNLTTVEGERSA